MKKVQLYIAISLDGKIAKPDGDVKWLENSPNPEKSDFGFGEFISGVDTVIMGNKTYQEILGFDIPFPYTDQKCYVFTRNKNLTEDENVQYVSGDVAGFVKDLRSREGGTNIWLVGGGQINHKLLEAGLVDELLVFVMPIILGEGIPFVTKTLPDKYLTLESSKTYPGGAVELRYSIA